MRAPVLITGGSGWVGSTVARELLSRGIPVLLLARGEKARARIRSLVGPDAPPRTSVEWGGAAACRSSCT